MTLINRRNVKLSVINAKLSVDCDHLCDSEKDDICFSKLKLVYFFLVHYVTHKNGNEILNSHGTSQNQNVAIEKSHPPTALHCILRHSKHLEGIQATGTPYFGDGCLDKILSRNPLKKLRRFILTDGSSTTDENATSATTGKRD